MNTILSRSATRFLILWLVIGSIVVAPHDSARRVVGQTGKVATVPFESAFNVKAFGAKGDGKALDSPAINRAIDAAAASGGGTVFFPAGTYRSFSVRLKSNITLYFDQGSVLLAA